VTAVGPLVIEAGVLQHRYTELHPQRDLDFGRTRRACTRRQTDRLTGRAPKSSTARPVVAADQLVRLHGIDAPELDQSFWWRGQQLVCGTMSLAARMRSLPVSRFAARLSSGTGTAAWSPRSSPPNEVDIGRRLVSAEGGMPAVFDGLRRRRSPTSQARDVAGHLRQTLGVARIVTAAPPGIHALGSGRDATAAGRIVIPID
jgi:hypothetical protein